MARGRVLRADKRWAKSTRAPYPWEVAPDCYWWSGDFGRTASDSSQPYPYAFESWTSGTGGATAVATGASDPDGGNQTRRFTESMVAGYQSIYVPTPTNHVAGPAIHRVRVRYVGSVKRIVLADAGGANAAIFDLSTATVIAQIGGCVASIASLGDAWYLLSVYADDMSAGYTTAISCLRDTDTTYVGYTGTGKYIDLYLDELVQHRHSAWTSQRAGGVAGAALSQSTPGSQPFSQVDASSPGGLSVFGKPCIWNPRDATLYLASSDAGLLSLCNGNHACTVLYSRLGADASVPFYGAGTNEAHFRVTAGVASVYVPDLGYVFNHPTTVSLGVPSVLYFEVAPNAGTYTIGVNGVYQSGSFAAPWVSVLSGVYSYARIGGIRELVVSSPLSQASAEAIRAGFLARAA